MIFAEDVSWEGLAYSISWLLLSTVAIISVPVASFPSLLLHAKTRLPVMAPMSRWSNFAERCSTSTNIYCLLIAVDVFFLTNPGCQSAV